MSELIKVNIDGVEIEVESGSTVLSACEKAGVKVPVLCHHPDLNVAGVCRVCMVEIEGMGNLQASYTYPITQDRKSVV